MTSEGTSEVQRRDASKDEASLDDQMRNMDGYWQFGGIVVSWYCGSQMMSRLISGRWRRGTRWLHCYSFFGVDVSLADFR